MSNINIFEKEIGITLEKLDYEKLLLIMQNSKYKKFFNTPKKTLDILDAIIEVNRNQNFIKELYTTKYSIELVEDECLIENLFKKMQENKITQDELLKELKDIRNSSDCLFSISAFLCSLVSKFENIREEENILIERIKETEKIFNLISDISSYKLKCDIIDLIYQVREYWFDAYGTDILLNISWVDNETDKLAEYEEKIYGKIKSVNIKPEELGLIDITKLKE